MTAGNDRGLLSPEEISAIIQEVRDRVRARYPASGQSGSPSLDLIPLVHARDAAEAKVAAIGTVNPRRGGAINWAIQSIKKAIARALDWHVREQVEFNRNVMRCVEATIEALNEVNRNLAPIGELRRETAELRDMRSHWEQWRAGWENKLFSTETQLLRSVAELQSAFQHRASLMESGFRETAKQMEANFREAAKWQHADFVSSLERNSQEVHKRFWADIEKIRLEFETLIHAELRLARQRLAVARGPGPEPPAVPQPQATPVFDYGKFAEKFRGSEESVREKQKLYLPYFAGRRDVLDIGCGRGEFLELMRDHSIPAHGIDASRECVELCLHKGLQAETADLFAYLTEMSGPSLDAIFSAQVVEHLPPERVPEMIRLAAAKLERGGLLAIETPNPECLAIFATHFYLDPTHTRPLPHPLLSFYMQEYGFGQIEVRQLSPAVESMPSLRELPDEFRTAFFGGLDYVIIGRKLM